MPVAAELGAARLAGLKAGRVISVCIPARDEASTVGAIVACIRSALVVPVALVDEILVVDDGSCDPTAEEARAAGARVVSAAGILAEVDGGRGPGKGQAMWKAVAEARGDLLVFCDADVANFGPHFVTRLLAPLLVDPGVAMVKASYQRPLGALAGEGGRVTELMARPLLTTLFPHLGGMAQPLSGEAAARRHVLEQVPFAHGYGVEMGLLVDVADRFGVGALAQADLGRRVHRNRPLLELGAQATAVLQVGLARARPWPPGPAGPAGPGWCPPLVEVPAYRRRRAGAGNDAVRPG